MKIIVGKNNLEIILRNFQAFLDKKDSSQITSHIYFEVIDTKLLLKATDYEIGIESKIDILKKESDGNATVNGRKILDIVGRLKDGEIILESDNDFIHIKQGKSKFKLPMFNASEFPDFPELNENTKINIDTSKFIQSIRKINPAVENTNQKIELSGALLDIKEYAFNFAATDTRRLAIVKYDTQSVENFSIIIPKKAINEILKLFYDDLEIFYNQTQLIIRTPNYTFFTKLINGKYPDYEKIIPKSFKNEIKLPKDIIIESIKLINSLSNNIKIIIKPNEIIFESISDENSEAASTQIEINTNIDSEVIIGANSKYILDFLSQIESSEFNLCLNELNTPFTLKDGNFSTIIMPIIF
ncbi:DNA polymerase III subunit beta [Helicobacter sp. 12S02232-10]|uniref:DNA polymerase III subunit beta n=1 Tax=Helicobacter sp. 12S02232-10 TaxID=1476197 RepID=UPI000BA7DBC6|nr:DNA polymerase III subunit beta [Helicobacter sp. 12S02232-10]PAF49452.1 DNA polymerase III subunit beta [Helicobacter sp. 12S02232-10]